MGTIVRYNARTGQFMSAEPCHKSLILNLVEIDGKVWSASYDKTVGVFDGNTGKLLNTLQGHTGPVLDIISTGDSVCTCSWDKNILVWNKNTYDCNSILNSYHTDTVTCLCLVKKKEWSTNMEWVRIRRCTCMYI